MSGDDLARRGHPGLGLLLSDYDPAAAGDPPLHRDGGRGAASRGPAREALPGASRAIPTERRYQGGSHRVGESPWESGFPAIGAQSAASRSSRIGDKTVRRVNAADGDVPATLPKGSRKVSVAEDGTEGSL